MALGRIVGTGGRAALLGLGDEKTPHPSPCCSVSVGMLLDCDISQSLLASCGSRLIVLLPWLLLSALSFASSSLQLLIHQT